MPDALAHRALGRRAVGLARQLHSVRLSCIEDRYILRLAREVLDGVPDEHYIQVGPLRQLLHGNDVEAYYRSKANGMGGC